MGFAGSGSGSSCGKDRRLNSGDFVNVTITSAMPFELIGKANG